MAALKKIFVAGHRGMVGSAIVRALSGETGCEVITRSSSELDLRDQTAVYKFFEVQRFDEVYLAAAKVGGILANTQLPAAFIFENLSIQTNVINAAFLSGVQRLLFLGSSCIYPREAQQPIAEEALLTGPLELTNEPYAIAKIAGIKQCESYNRQYGDSHGVDYRIVMPANLYGPGDNYHPDHSHVVAGLIQRFHLAKINSHPTVTIWGSGSPRREFLFVDDLARACLTIMKQNKAELDKHTSPQCSHFNVGSGADITIKELAIKIAKVVGYSGEAIYDITKPDGTAKKLMNIDKIKALGWRPLVDVDDGLRHAYADFLKLQNL